MAKRQGVRTIECDEVMGEGSFVKFRPIIYGTAMTAVKAQGDDNIENASLVIDLVVDSLIEWNWVDFDDNPLPLPQTSQELEDMLTMSEVQFLTREMIGTGERQKN